VARKPARPVLRISQAEDRLARARGVSDAAWIAERERVERHNEAVEKFNRKWYANLIRPRKPPQLPSSSRRRRQRRYPLGDLRAAGRRPRAEVTEGVHTVRLPLPGHFNHRGVLEAVKASLAPRGSSAGLDRCCALRGAPPRKFSIVALRTMFVFPLSDKTNRSR
jgi:hypothetical protein